jgi:hypothetical protein
MKLDPYNNKEKYLEWKEKLEDSISGLTKENSDLLLAFLHDMEIGVNVGRGSKKGARSFIRLRSLRDKLTLLFKKINESYNIKDVTKVKEDTIHSFFSSMENGGIRKNNGETYKAVADYVKIFKAFWHWHQKTSRKKGIEIQDITLDLDTTQNKPDWVYLTEEQIKKLCDNARYDYKVLMMFLFDTGIRAPTELMNVKVSDLYNDFKELQIREETSKTFGRRIKLMLCSDMVKRYVKSMGLKDNDYLFGINYATVNKYIQRLSQKLFGEGVSEAGAKYSELTMYDFRHCSCCYWLPRYKSESALKYRFGWKKSDKIHYYSELLGMKDTISEEDILIDVTRTEIEKRLEKSEKEKEIMQEKMQVMEEQIKKITELTNKLDGKIRN